MRNAAASLTLLLLALLACPAASAGYTLTFDEVPSGTPLAYSPYSALILFELPFQATDHTSSTWGVPHSSPNVMIWTAGPYDTYADMAFGVTTDSLVGTWIASVSGYFSTAPGAVVRMVAYDWNGPVASVTIGGAHQSWNNMPLAIGADAHPFYKLAFAGVSGSGLQGFCVDDLTVDLVPEPSSLLALFCGLAGLGAVVRRRRGQH